MSYDVTIYACTGRVSGSEHATFAEALERYRELLRTRGADRRFRVLISRSDNVDLDWGGNASDGLTDDERYAVDAAEDRP